MKPRATDCWSPQVAEVRGRCTSQCARLPGSEAITGPERVELLYQERGEWGRAKGVHVLPDKCRLGVMQVPKALVTELVK